MQPLNEAIAVEGLGKACRGVKVLDDLTFSVKPGTVFALLGSNGAGKTTTIKILSTLIRPDRGHAEVGGIDVVQQPEQVREKIALTGQFAALDEVLTGR